MNEFDFSAPADVYASRGRGASKRPVKYHRFDSAAEAIRFVIETLPLDMLAGTIMEIGEDRFLGSDIRRLYDSADYPLARPAAS